MRTAGIEWHHLAVKDVHAPAADFETRWVYAGAMLRERLRRGERVLVHCRGGLGRAGSVAARLLVEFVTTPLEATARLRVLLERLGSGRAMPMQSQADYFARLVERLGRAGER